MRIGVLALQGGFIEHRDMLETLDVQSFEIRQKKDLDQPMDGLILPGGESTVIGKLLDELELFSPIEKMVRDGLPVFGTCAGLLLLAKDIVGERAYLKTMDINVRRNAYGRQLGSFHHVGEFQGIGQVPMTFIRAPYIDQVEGDTEILAVVDGHIVAARQKNQLVTAFHPELDNSTSIHEYFIKIIKERV